MTFIIFVKKKEKRLFYSRRAKSSMMHVRRGSLRV